MKIVFCDNRLGGLLGFRRDVLRHFAGLGYELILAVPEPESDWDRVGTAPSQAAEASQTAPSQVAQEQAGYRVEYVPMRASATSVKDDLALFKAYLNLFKRERPDIIFCYTVKPNVYASVAARLNGIPTVCMVTGLGYLFAGNSLSRILGRLMYRVGLKCASHVLTLNESNRDLLLDRRFVKPSKLTLLSGGEGVDLSHYGFSQDRFADGDAVRFLMVSRVLEDKGYREFVSAARALKRELGSKVCFEILGPTAFDSPMGIPKDEFDADRGEVFDYLGVESDPRDTISRDGVVVVLPSYHEGMSRSLMEACAMGRPLIASDIPGCREMVKDGVNGYLCSTRDTTGLIAAMRSFLALSSQEKETMSCESRRYAEQRFDVAKVISVYDALL